jgi:Lon protease-like protein
MFARIKLECDSQKDIIIQSFENKRYLGISQPKELNQRLDPIEPIGSLVKIREFREIQFDKTDKSIFEISFDGIQRFKIKHIEYNEKKVAIAKVLYSQFNFDVEHQPISKINREKLIAKALNHIKLQGRTLNPDVFNGLSDKNVVDSISMSFDFTPYQRQMLLESVDYNDRYSVLLEIFEMDYPVPNSKNKGLDLIV